jgi:hypothetical protein
MLYITETCRFLDEPFKGMPKQLRAVRATTSDKPHDPLAKSTDYTPAAWKALLNEPGSMYRYRKEPYQATGLDLSSPSLAAEETTTSGSTGIEPGTDPSP